MRYFILLNLLAIINFCIAQESTTSSTSVLYNKVLNNAAAANDLVASQGQFHFSPDGLMLTPRDGLVKLNRYYALAQRVVRYHIKLSADAIAVFQSDQADFKAAINMKEKTISILTDPILQKRALEMDPEHEYLVEIGRDYQQSSLRLIDLYTGLQTEVFGVNDGTGGVGQGKENIGFLVGRQYDYYTFALQEGTSLLVKQITVQANQTNPLLIIYGDSITEPEGYYPTKSFDRSWTQLIINKLKGRAVSSGRGGTTINELLLRIKNELPALKPKYVMITIGTNGGNTEENLSQLVEYIQEQGSIAILNNIPANESASHIQVNKTLEKIRQKYNIKGCKFELATSINQLGNQVDESTMYFEDYDWGKIYHHPNVKGSRLMFLRTLLDVPEIYQ